jgi:hypothetical protein
MAESIKTPFGVYPRKKVLIGGAIIGGALIFVIYRARQAQGTATSTTDAAIDPATGFAYGSPEDAAALTQQAGYVSASGGGSGSSGGSDTTVAGQGFVTNAQWVQAVVTYMTTAELVADPTLLSEALGRYINGAPLTDAQVSLVEQAIAVEGHPPLSGANGYPPSINRAPVTPTVLPGAVTGLKATAYKYEIDLTWTNVAGATRYEIYRLGVSGAAKGQGSELVVSYDNNVKIYPLNSQSGYKFTVTAINAAGKGPSASVTATTK